MTTHEHEWVDVTAFRSTRKQLWCSECGATAWQTFAPVNISTRQDERDLEIDQEGAVFCADTPA